MPSSSSRRAKRVAYSRSDRSLGVGRRGVPRLAEKGAPAGHLATWLSRGEGGGGASSTPGYVAETAWSGVVGVPEGNANPVYASETFGLPSKTVKYTHCD